MFIHLEAEKHWVAISMIACHSLLLQFLLTIVPLSVEQTMVALLKPTRPVTVKLKILSSKLSLQTMLSMLWPIALHLLLGITPVLFIY